MTDQHEVRVVRTIVPYDAEHLDPEGNPLSVQLIPGSADLDIEGASFAPVVFINSILAISDSFKSFDLINTRLGVILPYVAFDLPMSILIALSYVRGIPDAIIESAEIDGAKYRQIFWSLIVPLSAPVAATMAILSFLRHWNEFLFVFIFTTKKALKSLPVAITQFAGRQNIEYGLQYASLVIGIMPMILFYMVFHRQLVKGFGEGALKE